METPPRGRKDETAKQTDSAWEATYREVLDSMYDGVYFVDTERRLRYWNQSAERLTGYGSEEVVGCKCGASLLAHVDEEGRQLCAGRCPLQATIEDGKTREAKIYLRHRDGHREAVVVRTAPMRDPDGKIVGGVEIFNTSDHLLVAMNQISTLEREATIDPLTGLANRRLLEQTLAARAAELKRYGEPYSVLFADIDHFKKLNDTWGHAAGDQALKTVAKTLDNSARTEDAVARWGGEEFVFVLSHTGLDGIEEPAERFHALVGASRVPWQSVHIRLTLSIGGAAARPGEDPQEVLSRADAALYRAKEEGRDRVIIDR